MSALPEDAIHSILQTTPRRHKSPRQPSKSPASGSNPTPASEPEGDPPWPRLEGRSLPDKALVEACEQVHDGRLAAAVLADDHDEGRGLDGEVEVLQHKTTRGAAGVGETDVSVDET